MKAFLAICACLAVSACAFMVTSTPVNLADGTLGYSISCNGTARSMADCVEKAGEICGTNGFRMVDQYGSAAPFSISQGNLSANQQLATAGYTSTSGMLIKRTLFVKCGK